MSPDSVVLEIAFARLAQLDEEEIDLLWRAADEQAWPAEQRRRLTANGFRCGVIGQQLPESLRRALGKESVLEKLSGDLTGLENDLMLRHERRQIRSGQLDKVPVNKQSREQMIVLLNENGAIRGETFREAQGVYGLKVHQLGDGRARIELVPEIHHGQYQQRVVSHEGAFRVGTERQRRVFDELRIDVVLSPGQTLLVGCTDDRKGLGQNFFSSASGQPDFSNLLVIRLAQTQADDLFSLDQSLAPIETRSP